MTHIDFDTAPSPADIPLQELTDAQLTQLAGYHSSLINGCYKEQERRRSQPGPEGRLPVNELLAQLAKAGWDISMDVDGNPYVAFSPSCIKDKTPVPFVHLQPGDEREQLGLPGYPTMELLAELGQRSIAGEPILNSDWLKALPDMAVLDELWSRRNDLVGLLRLDPESGMELRISVGPDDQSTLMQEVRRMERVNERRVAQHRAGVR